MFSIFHLITEPLRPYFNFEPPNTLNVSSGRRANLTCQASGIPRPVITWFRNGHRLLNSSVSGLKGHSMLTFGSVSLDDQGEYWCVATSIEGSTRSSSVKFKGNKLNFFSLTFHSFVFPSCALPLPCLKTSTTS